MLKLSAATSETPLDFERSAFFSAAQALQRCRSLEQVGSWGLRKAFPLSWLWFHIPEGLLLLPVLCGCLPEPTLSWFGQLDEQRAVGWPGVSDGLAPWIGSPWAQANSRAGRSTRLALRGRSKAASPPLGWQLAIGLTSPERETASSTCRSGLVHARSFTLEYYVTLSW